jgi:hypothetical protein
VVEEVDVVGRRWIQSEAVGAEERTAGHDLIVGWRSGSRAGR